MAEAKLSESVPGPQRNWPKSAETRYWPGLAEEYVQRRNVMITSLWLFGAVQFVLFRDEIDRK